MSFRLMITGGAGFVGSSLAVAFRRDHPDWNVVAFDNLKRRGSELSVERLRAFGHRGVNYVGTAARGIQSVVDAAAPGDVILTLGAGSVYQTGEGILRRLKERLS